MSKPVRFDPDAEVELSQAYAWYEAQRAGLGTELLDAVDQAVRAIGEGPGRHAPVPGVAPELGVRRVIVRRFPYSLAFIELAAEIRVIAVAHGRRRPGYWRTRVRNS